MKYIDVELAKEYNEWLTSYNNPVYTGNQKYDNYDNFFDRLIREAVSLGLIQETSINLYDISWLNNFQAIYNSNFVLKSFDKTKNSKGGGIASLKRFIDFIKFKNKNGKATMTAEERKELFRKYMVDCGKCNEQAGRTPSANSLDGYWFGLSHKSLRDRNIDPYVYDDEIAFESVKERIFTFDKGGDPSQGAKWYSEFLAECKFKKLLEWFVNQIKTNNEIIDGNKTQGKGADGNKIRNLYAHWRSYQGFELDCSVRLGYQAAQSGSNYIHLTDTWLNIVPVFTQVNGKSDITELKIVYKPDNIVEREYPSVTIQQLGLFDGSFPNQQLRKLFGDFKKEINALQTGRKISASTKEAEGKAMENKKEAEPNLILYGPPGTGKTYHTIPRAMSIIDAKSRGLKYWENEYENNKDRVLTLFNAELKKGYITNGRKYKTGHIAFVTFHQSYGYEEFIEGIKPNITASKAVFYEVADGLFKDLCNRADFDRTEQKNKQQGDWQDANGDPFVANENYVFIIDEINRGNVSKIFGELITLIEPTKRLGAEEEMTCILPYSGDDFGVPKNVYILGTMNTADRSLVQLDAALRRRFAFEEMMPDYAVIKKKVGNEGIVEDVDVARLLESINERITALLDREHQIGHSYFMKVGDARDLAEVFKKKIIPLLQEYFFDDYESIQKVLNEPKDSSGNFIDVKDNPFENDKKLYSVKKYMPTNADAYIKIYSTAKTQNSEQNGTNEE